MRSVQQLLFGITFGGALGKVVAEDSPLLRQSKLELPKRKGTWHELRQVL
jgi:hypothetical protein